MKNLFISIILSFTLTASIVNCSFNILGFNNGKPKEMVLEAPIVQNIIATIQWLMGGGGGGGQKGGSLKSPSPAPN